MRYVLWLVGAFFCISCSTFSRITLSRSFRKLEERFNHHTGFVLYNPQKNRIMYKYQADRYFTPASNTKVLTLYTALTLLGDSVPSVLYEIRNDSLIFCGTADPSTLNPRTFTNSRVLDLLGSFEGRLYLANNPMYTTSFGPGWAWSDYRYTYSVERAPFPLYGHYFTVTRTANGKTTVIPPFFKKYFYLSDSTERTYLLRDLETNRVDYMPARTTAQKERWEIPFKPSLTLTAQLLEDTLHKPVEVLPALRLNRQTARILNSVPADSLYKTMMQESDNFISEQLLMLCAWMLTDSLKPEAAIRFMMTHHLHDLPDKPVWVDGSGLSRYNLTTPRNMVYLWNKISRQVKPQRLFSLLAAGGKSGTLRSHYKPDSNQPPYLYGKTGTLSNNHCLSGFLITRKNRMFIFSFMNSNYVSPVSELRREMENILKFIYDKY